MKIKVKCSKAKVKLKEQNYDMDKKNTGSGDFMALDKHIREIEPNVTSISFDFLSDELVIEIEEQELTTNTTLFAGFGEAMEVVKE